MKQQSVTISQALGLDGLSDKTLEIILPIFLSVYEINDSISDLKLMYYDENTKEFIFYRKYPFSNKWEG